MTERQDTTALLFTWLQRCAKEAAEEGERERRKERERDLGGAGRADHGFGVLRSGVRPRRIERYDESHDLLLPVRALFCCL